MRFIDLFCGVGGFRLALEAVGGRCVFSSEIDKFAQKTYSANFGEVPRGDITEIPADEVPPHEVIAGGFPCQSFSMAGERKGLSDPRGSLFYEVLRIASTHEPRALFLENVPGLLSHSRGATFRVMIDALNEAGYRVSWAVIDSSPLVPQRRVRVYIVALRGEGPRFDFPSIEGPPQATRAILEELAPEDVEALRLSDVMMRGYSRRYRDDTGEWSNFYPTTLNLEGPSRCLTSHYGKDPKAILVPCDEGNPRRLTVREAARLQGFPESHEFPVSRTQAYRQLGNSVAVPVVTRIAEALKSHLDRCDQGRQLTLF